MSEKKPSIFSQELSFGKKNSKGGKIRYPEKTYINLVQDETEKNDRRALIGFGVFLVFLAIFVKFAVYDQLSKIAQAERAYNQVQAQINEVRNANNSYDAVKLKYDEVTDWYMTDEEKMEVDKNNVFRMLEDDIMPYVGIQSVQIAGNTIVVQTNVTNLHTVSTFLSILQNDHRNGFVTVTTANASDQTANNNAVIASVIITYGGGEGGN